METKPNIWDSGHFEQALDRLTQDYVYYFYREEMFFKRNIDEGSLILDVGCGEGKSTRTLANITGLEGKVVGIDNNQRMINTAKKKCSIYRNVDISLYDARDLENYPKQFDCVVFPFDMLGLLEKPDEILLASKRILKPKGKILATVFSEVAAPYQARQYVNGGAENVKVTPEFVYITEFDYRARRFSWEEIEKVFTKAELGCRIEELTSMAYGIVGTR